MSLLSRFAGAQSIRLVGINEVAFVPFPRDATARQRSAVGVQGLSACSVIIICTQHGAIVAHIGPNIMGAAADDTSSFIRLANEKVDQIRQLFEQHRNYFPANSQAYVIYAKFGEQIPEAHLAIFRRQLRELGLSNMIERTYAGGEQADMIDDEDPKGTVVVDPRDVVPRIYLEDKEITKSVWVFIRTQGIYVEQAANRLELQRTVNPPRNVWILEQEGERTAPERMIFLDSNSGRWSTRPGPVRGAQQ